MHETISYESDGIGFLEVTKNVCSDDIMHVLCGPKSNIERITSMSFALFATCKSANLYTNNEYLECLIIVRGYEQPHPVPIFNFYSTIAIYTNCLTSTWVIIMGQETRKLNSIHISQLNKVFKRNFTFRNPQHFIYSNIVFHLLWRFSASKTELQR